MMSAGELESGKNHALSVMHIINNHWTVRALDL